MGNCIGEKILMFEANNESIKIIIHVVNLIVYSRSLSEILNKDFLTYWEKASL